MLLRVVIVRVYVQHAVVVEVDDGVRQGIGKGYEVVRGREVDRRYWCDALKYCDVYIAMQSLQC